VAIPGWAKMMRRNWTRIEILAALQLYFRTPFGKLHTSNPDIILLASILNRTPGSVSMKLVNLANCDPNLKQKGLSNASKLDRILFDEFLADPVSHLDEVAHWNRAYVSVRHVGTDVPVTATSRRGQQFFREAVLANFNGRCAMVSLSQTNLLVASHIIPWAKNEDLRCDPRNGLLLSALHDKAFDSGVITLDDDLRVRVSPRIQYDQSDVFFVNSVMSIEGQRINQPENFSIDRDALKFHRNEIFQK